MGHGKSLVLKSSHEYAPDTKGLNGKKQSPISFFDGGLGETPHWWVLGSRLDVRGNLFCEPNEFSTMVILKIGPIDLRHKIIIPPKVPINRDSMESDQFLCSQPQWIISVPPKYIFRGSLCPPHLPSLLSGEERAELVKRAMHTKRGKTNPISVSSPPGK